jgi:hypothetical protein
MTCALVPVYGRDKTAIDHAREDVEAAKKSPSVQPAPPAPPKRSDSTTVTIIRKMKRKEYSVPRSNQE